MRRWIPHAVGVVVLTSAGLLAHGFALISAAPLGDESAYVCAAEAVAGGQLPYAACPRYFYPPALARGGALLVEHGGRAALLTVLRGLVWLGAVATVWLSLALTSWSFRMRTVVGALLMLVASPISQALELGNLSSAVAGLSIAALFVLEQSALLAAAALSLAILLKPLPVALPFLLIAQGLAVFARERGALPKPLIAGAVTALVCGAALALTGGLGSPQQFYESAQDNISVVRLLRDFGLMTPPASVFTVVLVVAAALALWRAREPRFVAGLALVTCLLSAPLVWNHSWLMVLPVLAAATDRAVARYRGAPGRSAARSRALLEALLVGLGACVLATSDELGAVFGERPLLNALFLSIPLLTPSLLLAYATRRPATVAS